MVDQRSATERRETQLEFLAKRVKDLGDDLESRSVNTVTQDPLHGGFGKEITVRDLVVKTETEMLRVPNFGRKSLNEWRELLSINGLHFGMDESELPKADKSSPPLSTMIRGRAGHLPDKEYLKNWLIAGIGRTLPPPLNIEFKGATIEFPCNTVSELVARYVRGEVHSPAEWQLGVQLKLELQPDGKVEMSIIFNR